VSFTSFHCAWSAISHHSLLAGTERGVARWTEQTRRRIAGVSLVHTIDSDRHHDSERIAVRSVAAVLIIVTAVVGDVTAAVTIVNKILFVFTGILIAVNRCHGRRHECCARRGDRSEQRRQITSVAFEIVWRASRRFRPRSASLTPRSAPLTRS
jgi:Flp pilus assembly CpaE family ATPase